MMLVGWNELMLDDLDEPMRGDCRAVYRERLLVVTSRVITILVLVTCMS
jgi:hypothetical protein